MDNLNEPKAYIAAEKYDYSFKLRMQFLWQYTKMNVIILLLFIPESLKAIKNFFIPPKPKCIANQVALITGGGNGLGRAIAFRLAKEKCKLAIVDIDHKAAQQTAQEIEAKFNVQTAAFRVDVSKHQDVAQLKTDVESALGNVDLLINNAGLLGIDISLREGTPEAIQKMIDVNLTSHFWILRTFLNGMIKRRRGHVVAISSFAGKLTIPCAVAYCATKFGVTGFMSALFDELCLFEQDDFIKTTTVYPTFVNTRKELGEKLEQAGVLPRLEPEHAAHLIVKGILTNRRNVFIPDAVKRSLILNLCPDRIIKYVKSSATDTSVMKRERSQNHV